VRRSLSPASRPGPKHIYDQRRLQAIALRWDGKAADWDQNLEDPACHLNEDQAYQRFLDQALYIIRRRRTFCAGQGVIDAGCATGLVLARVGAWFAWGIGVDISPEMIRLAQEKQIPKAKFLVRDCFRLASRCPKAGAVVSRGVLLSHYGPRQGALLLKSAHDCLVERGFVFLDFLNKASRDQYHHVPHNKTYFEPEEVCELASCAGFRTAQIYGDQERRVRMVLATK
jgi:SAM-dependent methyltransferase